MQEDILGEADSEGEKEKLNPLPCRPEEKLEIHGDTN